MIPTFATVISPENIFFIMKNLNTETSSPAEQCSWEISQLHDFQKSIKEMPAHPETPDTSFFICHISKN